MEFARLELAALELAAAKHLWCGALFAPISADSPAASATTTAVFDSDIAGGETQFVARSTWDLING